MAPGVLRYVDTSWLFLVVNDDDVVCIGNVDSQWSSNAEMHVPELLTVLQLLPLGLVLILCWKPVQPSSASHASLHPSKS